MKIKNKKGIALSLIILIIFSIVGLISGLVLIVKYYNAQDQMFQEEICRANIIGANSVLKGNQNSQTTLGNFAWKQMKGSTAKGLLQSPLCKTQVKTFDFRDIDDEEEYTKKAGLYIGEMVERCWKTFGEGKIPNTFGQKEYRNYYFPCYRFKILLEDNTDYIDTNKLMELDKGILWTHNVKGNKIPMDCINKNGFENEQCYYDTMTEYLQTGNKDYLSYGGYIFWEGHGSLEFAKEINYDMDEVAKIAAAATATNIAGTYILSSGFTGVTIMVVDKLTKINSDQYYEVRYYAPFIKDGNEDIELNSIKVVPIDIETKTKQIGGP